MCLLILCKLKDMCKKSTFLLYFLFVGLFCSNGQSYFWTGANENNDFFDEQNRIDALTNKIPSPESINPGKNINFNLTLSCDAQASGLIHLGDWYIKNYQRLSHQDKSA